MEAIKLLLIEDNEADAFYLKEILSSSQVSLDIDCVDSVESGIKALKEKSFDAVITDLTLPGSSGLNTFEKIYMNTPPETPILILTGLNDRELGLRAVNRGAQDYIVKDGINADVLIKSISYSIERKRANSIIEKQKKEIETAYQKLKEQQLQLIHTEKMGSIGTMVAGIAHELNNPMMGIINCIQFCLDTKTPESIDYEYLKLAEEATDRCVKIVKNLLTFSHKDDDHSFTEENILTLIEQVLLLSNYRITSKGIKIIYKVSDYIPDIYVKANNIKQVFLNLLTNAIDALDENDNKEIIISIDRFDENIIISFEDNGKGIPEEVINKIFDPFFSTKPVGKGTGLGLSICNNIVRDHSGRLSIRNRDEGGVISEIILPARSKSFVKLQEAAILR
ncbi:MAG: ATP-binding protein [Thermodesulfobacteriota bacterium]